MCWSLKGAVVKAVFCVIKTVNVSWSVMLLMPKIWLVVTWYQELVRLRFVKDEVLILMEFNVFI